MSPITARLDEPAERLATALLRRQDSIACALAYKPGAFRIS